MALNIQIAGTEERPLLKVFLVGPAGAGKSRLCSTAPNNIVASCESRMNVYAENKVPYQTIRSARDMDELIKILKQPAEVREQMVGAPVDTFTIDTLDGFQSIIKAERIAKNGGKFLRDDWGWLKDQMVTYMQAIMALDLNIMVTCHIGDVTDEDGRILFNPLLEGAFKGMAPSYFDIVGILKGTTSNKAGQKQINRVLQLFPEPSNNWVKDSMGKLGYEFEVNLKDDFQRMTDLCFQDWNTAKKELEELQKVREVHALERIAVMAQVLEEKTEAPEIASEAPESASGTEGSTPSQDFKTVSKDEETISSFDFNELVGKFESVEDIDEKKALKFEFMEKFGNPKLLPVDKLEEAQSWIREKLNIPEPEPRKRGRPAGSKTKPKAPDLPEVPQAPQPCSVLECPNQVEDQDLIELAGVTSLPILCEDHFKEANNQK